MLYEGPAFQSQMEFNQVAENPDGSIDFETSMEMPMMDMPMAPLAPQNFYTNLALEIPEAILKKLGKRIVRLIEEDDSTREAWLSGLQKVVKYLGFSIEDTRGDLPLENGCAIFDTTMSAAVIEYFAHAMAELFPSKGPASIGIYGEMTAQKHHSAYKIENYLNLFLTAIDTAYETESQKLIFNTGILGTGFRKTYFDESKQYPVSRYIHPENLIVNTKFISFDDAPRITEVGVILLQDLLRKFSSKVFRKVNLRNINQEVQLEKILQRGDSEDPNEDLSKLKDQYKYFEVHLLLSEEELSESLEAGDDVPESLRPYVLHILEDGEILSIVRNWQEGDEEFRRKDCYTRYVYLPGIDTGVYGLGIGHVMGSNAIYMTNVLRQVLNAESLRIFPFGIKKSGLELKKSTNYIGARQFFDINIHPGQGTIDDAVKFLTMPPTDSSIIDVMRFVKEQTNALGVAANTSVPEGSYDMPVGTTLAMLEQKNRVTSIVVKGLHKSLSRELQLLYSMFAEGVYRPIRFTVETGNYTITPEDFLPDFQIIPSSDGSVSSFAQDMIKAESLLKMAQSSPELHDMRAVFRKMYEAMKIDNIDEIMPPPKPPEPAPPSIDPNKVLEMDVQNKLKIAEMKHETEILKLQLEKVKIQQEYAIEYQKMAVSAREAGIVPVDPINIPMPEIQNSVEEEKIKKQVEEQQRMQQQQLDQSSGPEAPSEAAQPMEVINEGL